MPTQNHPLDAQAAKLDELFWAKVNEESKEEVEVVITDSVKEFRKEIKAWIVKFDENMKEAIRLMGLPMGNEKKPFEEKYQARELLEELIKDLEGKQEWHD